MVVGPEGAEAVVESVDQGAQEMGFGDAGVRVFVDESGRPHTLSELARASWGLVLTTSEGVVRGSLFAPAQWPIEQTSAAGEWCAAGGLTQVLEAGQCVEVWADY